MIVVVGSKSGGDTFAMIVVTYPSGSTCTATNGSKTLVAKDTTGSWVFKIPTPASLPETWTVSCTDGTDRASTPVTISTEGQSVSVTLAYNLYFIQNGRFASSSYTYNLTGGQNVTPTVTENYPGTGGSCVRVFPGKNTSSRTNLYFTPKYQFPDAVWKYLICEYQVRGFYDSEHAGSIPAFGVLSTLNSQGGSNGTVFVAKKTVLSAATETLTAKVTEYISVENINGEYWIGFSVAGSSAYTGEFLCYNLYMSKEAPA